MAHWNRRRFLALTASAGVSAYASLAGWNAPRRYRAGMIGWHPHSLQMAAVFGQTLDLDVVAVTGSTSNHRDCENLLKFFPKVRPPLYPDVEAMLRDQAVDFLYTTKPGQSPSERVAHLLIEDADPEDITRLSADERCIQVLPRYEFSGLGRPTGELSGTWTRAVIDCHVTLPESDFATRAELSAWLYRQIGDAVDFSCEMMEFALPAEILGLAAPADSPYSARFAWRIHDHNGRAIDVSVYASHSSNTLNRTTLLLRGEGRTVSLTAAPRSSRLSHLVALNLMHAIGAGDPGLLLYRVTSFAPVRELLSHAVLVL